MLYLAYMKSKIITSLILTIFLAVMALCFVHAAMMAMPLTAGDCVISAKQAICSVGLMGSWKDLVVALPPNIVTLIFVILASILLSNFSFKKIETLLFRPFKLYSKTYPNFSSLNFLSYAFSRGILHPKLF